MESIELLFNPIELENSYIIRIFFIDIERKKWGFIFLFNFQARWVEQKGNGRKGHYSSPANIQILIPNAP